MERIKELAATKEDFGFETTLSGRTYVKLFGNRKDEGYRIVLFFLWLPNAEMALARVANRVRQGGHSVAEDDVRRRYTAGLRNLFRRTASVLFPLAPVLGGEGRGEGVSVFAKPSPRSPRPSPPVPLVSPQLVLFVPTPLAGVGRGFVTRRDRFRHTAPTPLAGVERGFVTRRDRFRHTAPTPLAGVERRVRHPCDGPRQEPSLHPDKRGGGEGYGPALMTNRCSTPASGVGANACQYQCPAGERRNVFLPLAFRLYRPLLDAWWLYDASRLPPQRIAQEVAGKRRVKQVKLYRLIERRAEEESDESAD